jgi:hypothetical protein
MEDETMETSKTLKMLMSDILRFWLNPFASSKRAVLSGVKGNGRKIDDE